MGITTGQLACGRLQTTPMSRPSLKPPDLPNGDAKPSSMVRPSERRSGRDR
jgi:hypothetical protein